MVDRFLQGRLGSMSKECVFSGLILRVFLVVTDNRNRYERVGGSGTYRREEASDTGWIKGMRGEWKGPYIDQT